MLFDDDDFDDDAPIVPEHLSDQFCLIVPVRAGSSEELNEIEMRYRRAGRPPILFIDNDNDDGDVLGNAAEIARFLNVSPVGLTLSIAEDAMAGAWAAAAAQ